MVVYDIIEEKGLVRAYSDKGLKIRGGMPLSDYSEAVDPLESDRRYEETDIPVDDDEVASEDDYIESLRRVGVEL